MSGPRCPVAIGWARKESKVYQLCAGLAVDLPGELETLFGDLGIIEVMDGRQGERIEIP